MKRAIFALCCLAIAGNMTAQQTPLYLLFNSSCMDQLEYRYVYAGATVSAYSLRPTANEQYILTAGSGGINSPTLPKNTVNCREYALNDQFLNDVNSLTRQVYIVHQLSKGYLLTPVIAATQIMRSGSYYLFRAPNYSFAVDTTNLVYESNIATGTSSWYIYFNGLKIRGCYYEYSFKREPTKANFERSEFDFVPGLGITSERTGATAAEAENNHFRLIKINGMALEDYIVTKCQNKTTPSTTPPLSQWSPQVNYGTSNIREGDKELTSIQNKQPGYDQPLPPPLADCPEPPGEGYHIVQPGETLNGISRAYKVAVKSLVSWNKIKDPDVIQVCQKIWLNKPPAGLTSLAYKGSDKSPALYAASTERTVVRQDIYWKNTASGIQPAQNTATQTLQTYSPAAQAIIHTVQKGETLYGIGARYGLSEWEMRRLNNFPSSGDVVIKPGMQLLIAECSPSTASATTPATNPVYQPSTTTLQPANTGGGILPELYTAPTNTQPVPANTAPTTTPTQPVKQATYFQEYIVREGDTINAIAVRFKVNAQELALVNNKEPNETLITGQRLLIPKN